MSEVNSLLHETAAEIADVISNMTFDGHALTASVVYAPDFDLAGLAHQAIAVVPVSSVHNVYSRQVHSFTFLFHVAVCQRIDGPDVLGKMTCVLESVIRRLHGSRLQHGTVVRAVSTDVCNTEALRDLSVFKSVCTLTVKTF